MSVILKPIITEKMTAMGDKFNHFGFIVSRDASKEDIRKEIEDVYDVNVLSIRTMIFGGKRKRRYTRSGVISGKENSYKKAIVSLEEGESIDFYSNI